MRPAAERTFTAAERRVIARCTTPRAGAARISTGCPTTPSRRPAARRCAASAASSATAPRTAWRRRSPRRSSSSSTAIRRCFSVSSRSTSSITCCSSTAHRGRWGSVARSRDPGLHGRRPVFRDAARSRAQLRRSVHRLSPVAITGYTVVNIADLLGDYDWRLSPNNVWKAERVLLDAPHRAIRSSDARIDALRRKYIAYRKTHDDKKPLYYRDRDTWSELPHWNLEIWHG